MQMRAKHKSKVASKMDLPATDYWLPVFDVAIESVRLINLIFKSHFLRISRIETHSQKIEIFFLFCQNIPLGKLIQEKIIKCSNE